MSPLLRALEKVSIAWRSSSKRAVHDGYSRQIYPAMAPASASRNVTVAIFSRIGESGIAPGAGVEAQRSLAGVLFLNNSDVRIVQKQEFARWRESWR